MTTRKTTTNFSGRSPAHAGATRNSSYNTDDSANKHNDKNRVAPANVGLTAEPPRSVYSSTESRLIATAEPRRGLQDALFSTEPSVPVSIFSTELSALQAVVRYLHDARQFSFSEIAALLNRSPKTVWTTYAHAKSAKFPFVEDALTVPLSRFSRRDLAPLEALVTYLLKLGFSNAEAARTLKLDPRTTWTAAKRAERKHADKTADRQSEAGR